MYKGYKNPFYVASKNLKEHCYENGSLDWFRKSYKRETY
jgi:hypothetical protein